MKLKETYTTDEQRDSIQSSLVLKFAGFRQLPNESIDVTAARFHELLSIMEKYDVARSEIDQRTFFLHCLRPKFFNLAETIRDHERFSTYKLSNILGILKAHESKIVSNAKATMISAGSLALNVSEI